MSTEFDRSSARLSRLLSPSSPRALAVLSVLVMGGVGLGVTDALPALASSLPPASTDVTPKHAAPADAVQSYEVPLAAEPEVPQRTAEVEIVPAAWVAPTKGELRDGFGPRPVAPVAGVSRFHSGQDIGAPCGAPIRAAAAGRVTAAGWGGSYGNRIVLESKRGVQTVYAHAGRLLVRTGAKVEAGARIAEVGTTGASTGCHLHFEVHVKDEAVNPTSFMLRRGVQLSR